MAMYTNCNITYRVFTCASRQEADQTILNLFTKDITEKTGIPYNQIRFVPAKPGKEFLLKWNEMFSVALNTDMKKTGSCKFRVGDRVMQIRNDYDRLRWDVTNSLEEMLANPDDLKCIDRMFKGPDAQKTPVGAGFGIYAGYTGTVVSLNEATQIARIYYDNMCVTDYPFDTMQIYMDYAYGVSMYQLSNTTSQAMILDVWDADEIMIRLNLASMLHQLIRSVDKELYIVGDANSIEKMRFAIKEATGQPHYYGPKLIEGRQ